MDDALDADCVIEGEAGRRRRRGGAVAAVAAGRNHGTDFGLEEFLCEEGRREEGEEGEPAEEGVHPDHFIRWGGRAATGLCAILRNEANFV